MKRIINTGLIALVLLVLLYSIQQCNGYKHNAEINATTLRDTVMHYKNRLGTQTATVSVVLLDNKALREQVVNKDAKLKALAGSFAQLHSVERYTTVARIDTVAIAYTDTVPCVFNRNGKIENSNYNLAYSANQKGIIINSLVIPDSVTIITGYKRKWFFGKEVLVTDVTHSNPLIKVTQMQMTRVMVSVPFYKKWYVWLAAGVVGGLALAK